MLYLEDYLEMIEHLPQELRDRFTEIREMDLTVHNNTDELEKRVKTFFSDCKRHGELPPTVDIEFQAIRKEYYKALEDADEKVHVANQMYDLVDKYLRRLDTELHKFKCELEADNKGITEVLEKRSFELDTPMSNSSMTSQQQKENRYESSSSFRYSRPRTEKRRDSSASFGEKRQALTASPSVPITDIRLATVQAPPTPGQSYALGSHKGAGPAIAAAASQAIAATQQMQQGRRTASLKASYEAINPPTGHSSSSSSEFSIGRELAGAAQTAIQAIQQDSANNKKKQKKWGGWQHRQHEFHQFHLHFLRFGGGAARGGGRNCRSRSFGRGCAGRRSDRGRMDVRPERTSLLPLQSGLLRRHGCLR
ncbi:unnamed protein product [Brassicogethes aeneus]|uniref:Inhibitor of growth protein N-terminal histone-binding domain-containing protein n=1 Tax=Brassicogethes aeneus TaxID=1431903 RepID=A0A9P0FL55_BRAAE|nr:unnamed protein product [Brassicogethes aeneus]